MRQVAAELLRFGGGTLVSFDIDGTLELGDPPGPIPAGFVAEARQRGCLIGSASDRTLREQEEVWTALGLEPHFISRKHQLSEVRQSFSPVSLFHIGDTHIDEHFARLAGFRFIFALDLAAVLAGE
jgi:hydroxymethylpyrimidine pyrophosphatase-like HAD family hydrolase